MHVLVITFHLQGITEEQYADTCTQVAPAFAEVPGLISKTFLANRETNTYGGVYFWRDRASLDAFRESELARAVATDPTLAGMELHDFTVMEEPTRITRGLYPDAVAA